MKYGAGEGSLGAVLVHVSQQNKPELNEMVTVVVVYRYVIKSLCI